MQEKFIQEMYAAVLERTIKRLWILAILLIIALVGTNAGWIYYENQFADETTITQEADTGSGNGSITLNGTGSISYGESETDDNKNP